MSLPNSPTVVATSLQSLRAAVQHNAKALASVTLARRKNVNAKLYSRAGNRECFAYYGARNRDEIARTIAKVLPVFAPYVQGNAAHRHIAAM